MRGNKGGGGLEGYISCVYIRPASAAVWFSWSSLYEAKVKLEELKKKKKNRDWTLSPLPAPFLHTIDEYEKQTGQVNRKP